MERPLHANRHCRHYSYERNAAGTLAPGGARCARGVDLSAPAAFKPCMPSPSAPCTLREDYTDDERAAWKAHVGHRLVMLGEAVDAIPGPVKPGTQGSTTCPHCAGFLRWTRVRSGNVWLQCTGPDCIGPVHFNVPSDREWPAPATKERA